MSARMEGRLRVERFGEGAVVLDRETGRFFRASPIAARIAEDLTRGLGPPEIAAQLAARFAMSEARVEADVRALVTALDRPVVRAAANEVRFRRAYEGHCMSLSGRDVAVLSPDGRVLRRLDPERDVDEARARAVVRLALPHALTLQGVTVLHASAVHVAGAVHAFSGPSGAGKTTLAAALVTAGAEEESEDLVLLVPGTSSPTVACGAERWLRAWIERSGLDAALAVPEVRVLAAWPVRAPLARVAFLEGRRDDPSFAETRLDAVDVCTRLLANAFAETEDPDVFDACLRATASIAREVTGIALVVPEGLARLVGAAARYSASTTS